MEASTHDLNKEDTKLAAARENKLRPAWLTLSNVLTENFFTTAAWIYLLFAR